MPYSIWKEKKQIKEQFECYEQVNKRLNDTFDAKYRNCVNLASHFDSIFSRYAKHATKTIHLHGYTFAHVYWFWRSIERGRVHFQLSMKQKVKGEETLLTIETEFLRYHIIMLPSNFSFFTRWYRTYGLDLRYFQFCFFFFFW